MDELAVLDYIDRTLAVLGFADILAEEMLPTPAHAVDAILDNFVHYPDQGALLSGLFGRSV